MAEKKKHGLFQLPIITALDLSFLKKTRFCSWISVRTIKWINFSGFFLGKLPSSLYCSKAHSNSNRTVNALDWSMMAGVWFSADAIADLNKDGIVNSIDFSLLNRNWGKTQ